MYRIKNHIELAVIDFVRLRSELKKLLLEVKGTRVPVGGPADDANVEKSLRAQSNIVNR